MLDDVIILIVPVYNIGGMLNRNSYSRTNQNGPEAYGFRGNARNLDLNRDFIKADSRNTRAIHALFNRWKPDIFIDTHTSNGADYPYTMTLITNIKERLAPSIRTLLYDDMLPHLFDEMESSGWEMIPYVHARTTPDEGIAVFNDLPRYSMGYGALHHIPSFTTEAHMLKPFKDRVLSTLQFLKTIVSYAATHKKKIRMARNEALIHTRRLEKATLSWSLDLDHPSTLNFKGYTPRREVSAVTGKERLRYDHSAPFEKNIPYYNRYNKDIEVNIPHTYVLPQAYVEIAELLRSNGVMIKRSRRDSLASSQSYRIIDFQTRQAYEGHYLHYDVQVEEVTTPYEVHSGDYVISTDQDARRYIVETLEPQAPDAFFAWNFFDGILMQKEYFSPYVFEDTAARLLATDASLKERFEEKKAIDTEFAVDAYAQLKFIYMNSPHYEDTHMCYPVGRLFD